MPPGLAANRGNITANISSFCFFSPPFSSPDVDHEKAIVENDQNSHLS